MPEKAAKNSTAEKDRIEVRCPGCGHLYNLNRARLPAGRKASFTCRLCSRKVKLDLRSLSDTDETSMPSQGSNENRAEDNQKPTDEPCVSQKGRALKKKILQGLMGVLPPMPQVVLKAQEILSDPGSGIKELASVIATDPAISVRILKMANSAYFGLAGKVTSIGHASVLLGGKTLGEIVMMAGTSNLLSKELKGYGVKSEDIWRHSLAVGIGSRLIAGIKGPELANIAFMAGLIHDAGKIMLDEHVLKNRKEFELVGADGKKTLCEVEQQVLGLDHSEMGHEACKSWGIPEILITAVKHHHKPSMAQDNDLAHIVHMADFLATNNGMGTNMEGIRCHVEDATVEFLGLQQEKIGIIKQKVSDYVEKITGQMNLSL